MRPRARVTGIIGVISSRDGGLALTLFSRERRIVARVIGSEAYLLRALVAVGLAPTVVPLTKNRRRRELPLVGRKPANGHA
jgi:hypothetical protein